MQKKTDTETEDGFLTRWSAKKNQSDNPVVETEIEIKQDEIVNNSNQIDHDAENQIDDRQADEQPELTDEDMPDIATLDEKSDFSGFLSPGVSEELRKLALRKLFRSKIFNVRDGLDDYDDDFRSFAALGDIITSDMKHQMEMAQEREKQEQEQERLAREEELARKESDDSAADGQGSEDQDNDDKQLEAENSETKDEVENNEISAVQPEKHQDPQA